MSEKDNTQEQEEQGEAEFTAAFMERNRAMAQAGGVEDGSTTPASAQDKEGVENTEKKTGEGDGAGETGKDDGAGEQEEQPAGEARDRIAELERRGAELGKKSTTEGTENTEGKTGKEEGDETEEARAGAEMPALPESFPTEFKGADGKTYQTAKVMADLDPDVAGLITTLAASLNPASAKASAGMNAEAVQELVAKEVTKATEAIRAESTKELEKRDQELGERRFIEEVSTLGKHYDAKEILTSDGYWKWIDKAGKNFQLLAERGSAQDVADLITAYKENIARTRNKNIDAKRDDDQRRRRDLHRSSARSEQTGRFQNSEDNAEEGFHSAFSERAQKAAQGRVVS